MISDKRIHWVQVSILATLRQATRARYSELLSPTGLESDQFKYHVRKLITSGYIYKADDGLYELTAEGKEFANRLNEKTGREIEQPKVSMLLIVTCKQNGLVYYLAHRRAREPFRNYWGIMSAPLLRGVPMSESATRECKKQTGITAEFSPVGVYRVIDKTPGRKVLEDKLFSIMQAKVPKQVNPQHWYGGESVWMTKEMLLAKGRLFATTARTLEMVEQSIWFDEANCTYAADEY